MAHVYPNSAQQDIRVRYDTSRNAWVLEQVQVIKSHGQTDPGEIAAILNLNQEVWEYWGEFPVLLDAMKALVFNADQHNARVREVLLAPFTTQSPDVIQARDLMLLFTP